MFDEYVAQPSAPPHETGGGDIGGRRREEGHGCGSIFSFFLRAFLYIVVGVLGAVAAGGMGSLNRKWGDNYCFYSQKDTAKAGNCDFLLYSNIACCILGFLFFGVMMINICRSSFNRSKMVVFEFILSLAALAVMLTAVGILTRNLSLFCKNNHVDKLGKCVKYIEHPSDKTYQAVDNYILMTAFGTWIAAPVWLVLSIILFLRMRRALENKTDYNFNNPLVM
eukprot:m.19370 g.19370  ORF g.19370 m.19370 type:complete len:223 (-) comp8669_c0_seq1:621-1289(-)